jgi:hypothetical protein
MDSRKPASRGGDGLVPAKPYFTEPYGTRPSRPFPIHPADVRTKTGKSRLRLNLMNEALPSACSVENRRFAL